MLVNPTDSTYPKSAPDDISQVNQTYVLFKVIKTHLNMKLRLKSRTVQRTVQISMKFEKHSQLHFNASKPKKYFFLPVL